MVGEVHVGLGFSSFGFGAWWLEFREVQGLEFKV